MTRLSFPSRRPFISFGGASGTWFWTLWPLQGVVVSDPGGGWGVVVERFHADAGRCLTLNLGGWMLMFQRATYELTPMERAAEREWLEMRAAQAQKERSSMGASLH